MTRTSITTYLIDSSRYGLILAKNQNYGVDIGQSSHERLKQSLKFKQTRTRH